MVGKKVIEPETTESVPLIVSALMTNGLRCFRFDYQQLNAITTRDLYHLPRMEECIDSLGDAAVFSTLNGSSGHRKTKIGVRNLSKTAFKSHQSLRRRTRMLFGLRNTIETVQIVMNVIFAFVRRQMSLFCLEGIVFFQNHQRFSLSKIGAY